LTELFEAGLQFLVVNGTITILVDDSESLQISELEFFLYYTFVSILLKNYLLVFSHLFLVKTHCDFVKF
jgi:hypothetical protein